MSIPQEYLDWRGVETPCHRCHGSGVLTYGNTSTWRHGFGGQAITSGVCDHCWGSGDELRPWQDLRKLEAERDASIDRLAAERFAQAAGVSLKSLRDVSLALADVLEREGRRRKPPVESLYWEAVCMRFAKTIRDAVNA